MTEERYWAALFGIVNDGGLADIDNVVGKIDDDYETGDEIDDNADVMEGGGDNDNSMMPPPTEAQSPPENNNEKKKLGRTPIAKLGTWFEYAKESDLNPVYLSVLLTIWLLIFEERAYFDDNGATESKADATNTPPFYLEEIKSQQAHIAQLQKSLREANHKTRKLALELHKERKKRHDEGVVNKEDSEMKTNNSHSDPVKSCPRCNSSLTKQQPHKGKWEIHPDCNEFMKLDDHLKDNLRKEKEKRLDEVRSQMKFILDTDDIKDSYGKWSCCGKEEYEADGCA